MILWAEVLRTDAAVSHVEKNRFCFTGLIAFARRMGASSCMLPLPFQATKHNRSLIDSDGQTGACHGQHQHHFDQR